MQTSLTSKSTLPKQLNRTSAQAAPVSRRSRVVVNAQKEPSEIAKKAFSILTAAQLALLPIAGNAQAFNLFPKTSALPQAVKQLLPETAQSQGARDALNAKTDALPTLKETGKELIGGSDPLGASSATDVGKAIDRNTPDLDLTKNPKQVAQDAGKAIKNAVPDLSDATPTINPGTTKDSGASSGANLPSPGPLSDAAQTVGKKVVDSLPNPPDLSNPKGSLESNFPTLPKVARANPLQDVSDAGQFTDNKPNFPLPNLPGETNQNQDVFKQLGDKARDILPGGGPNPGQLGESLAKNIDGPSPKDAAKDISQNAPDLLGEADKLGGAVKRNANNAVQDMSSAELQNKAQDAFQKLGNKVKDAPKSSGSGSGSGSGSESLGEKLTTGTSGSPAEQVKKFTPNIAGSSNKAAEYAK
jgi:hypothetical protein